jgi:hypothetical protein
MKCHSLLAHEWTHGRNSHTIATRGAPPIASQMQVQICRWTQTRTGDHDPRNEAQANSRQERKMRDIKGHASSSPLSTCSSFFLRYFGHSKAPTAIFHRSHQCRPARTNSPPHGSSKPNSLTLPPAPSTQPVEIPLLRLGTRPVQAPLQHRLRPRPWLPPTTP